MRIVLELRETHSAFFLLNEVIFNLLLPVDQSVLITQMYILSYDNSYMKAISFVYSISIYYKHNI